MSTLGPGDLAVIIKSRFPENVGRIVLVDRLMKSPETIYVDGMSLKHAAWAKPHFLVWSKGAPLTVGTYIRGSKKITNVRLCRASLFPPNRLRKLDFDIDSDETLTWKAVPNLNLKEIPCLSAT